MHQTRNVVTILVGIAAAWWIASGVLQVFTMFADVFTLFGFAWLLNLLLQPLVERLSNKIPRVIAWTCGYVSVLFVLAILTAPLAAQATTLPETLPVAIQSATKQADSFLIWLRSRQVPVPSSIMNALQNDSIAAEIAPTLLSWSLTLINMGGQFILVIVIAASMTAGDDSLRHIVLATVPDNWLASAGKFYDDVRNTYSAAIRGQLIVWAMGMLLSIGTMTFFGTPGLLLWIGPIALVRLLPYIGGLLGGSLTIIIMLLTMPWPDVLAPVLIFFLLQNIIGYVVEPRVLGRALQLSPALVLFAVLVGWKLGGITGIVFGVPAIALIQTLAEHRLRTQSQHYATQKLKPSERGDPPSHSESQAVSLPQRSKP